MKEVWTRKWKKVLLWLSGYLTIVAYAIVGGYTIVKSQDEELKKTAKTVLIVTLIFTAIDAFLLIFHGIGSMANYYNSAAYDFYSIMLQIVNIGKVIVYAVFIILALVGPDGASKASAPDQTRPIEQKEQDKDEM